MSAAHDLSRQPAEAGAAMPGELPVDLPATPVVDPRTPPANEAPRRGRPQVVPDRGPIDPTQYLDFVRRVATRMARNLPTHVSLDDLIGAGTVGLLDAMARFDPAKADRFETFAEFRVKGAILDELRRYDLMARNARLTTKRLARKTHELTARHGRPPTESEMAQALRMSTDDYRRLVNRIGQVRMVSLDDVSGPEGAGHDRAFELSAKTVGPEDAAHHRELLDHLHDAIELLPPRQQRILEMYYQRDLTLKQIGHQVGVTESRVCQIMGEATRRLRRILQERRRAL